MNRGRLVAILSVLLLAACAGSTPAPGPSTTSSAPKAGGVLTVGVEAAWRPVDPLSVATFTDNDIALAVFDPLFRLQPNGTLAPDLATSYSAENGSQSWVFTLRRGVTFQDGTPFNSAAVVFNLKRVSNPANACTCLTLVKNITSVVPNGDYSVTVHLSQPDNLFANTMATSAGLMASPAAVAKHGKSFGLNPVGAGPFKYESQVPGNSISFVRWAGYWDKPKPYLDGVTFKVITDADSRFASLQSGSIADDENITPNQVATTQSSADLQVTSLGGLGTIFVQFQTQAPPFNNLLARQAVTYATNPGPINSALFDGRYDTGIESPWTPQSWAYPGPKVPGYPAYDLVKAKQLVATLGGLSFTLTVTNTPVALAQAQALQGQWAQAGIKAQIIQQETLTLVNNSNAGKYQAMLYRWQGAYDPDGNVYLFFLSNSPANASKLADPTVDSLLAQERAETSQAARKATFQTLAEQLAKDAPYDYLFAADWWRASKKQVHGIPPLANNWMQLAGAWMS